MSHRWGCGPAGVLLSLGRLTVPPVSDDLPVNLSMSCELTTASRGTYEGPGLCTDEWVWSCHCASPFWHTVCRGTYEGPDLYTSASALAAARPYVVPLCDIHIHFMHSGAVADWGHALNGAVVGLAHDREAPVPPRSSSGGRGPHVTGSLSGRQAHGTPLPCVGLGLVRAVDMVAQELYLLTPTPLAQLQQVRGGDGGGCVRVGTTWSC